MGRTHHTYRRCSFELPHRQNGGLRQLTTHTGYICGNITTSGLRFEIFRNSSNAKKVGANMPLKSPMVRLLPQHSTKWGKRTRCETWSTKTQPHKRRRVRLTLFFENPHIKQSLIYRPQCKDWEVLPSIKPKL